MSFTLGKKLWKSRTKKSGSPDYVPKSYQKECIRFGVSRPAAGFLLAPGLGKTSIILFIFKILKGLGLVDHLFVLSKKKIVYYVWQREIKKWGLPFTSVILHGKDKSREVRKNYDVYLMNFEGLPWFVEKRKAPLSMRPRKWLPPLSQRFFKKRGRVMLVCDESSKLRNTNTQRFKKLKKILPQFIRRYILTGSPAPKGLMNLFGQIYVLDLGESLGAYITHFRNTYFQPSGYMGMDWQLQKGGDKRIFKAIKPMVVRYGHDQLDMPPLTIIDRKIHADKFTRRVYNEMERELIIRVREGEITAANAAVASGKCRQIANGGLYYEDEETGERKWKRIHDAKCEELVELLDELEGEPALVAFEFGHDVYRIKNYLKKHAPQYVGAPFIRGKTKEKKVDRYLAKWDRGDLPVMFAQTGTVSHGLNLQGKGGIIIFFALTWSLEDYEQFIYRVWRQGQSRRVLVYRLIMPDTVDEDMIKTIASNDRTQQAFLKAMEKRHGIR